VRGERAVADHQHLEVTWRDTDIVVDIDLVRRDRSASETRKLLLLIVPVTELLRDRHVQKVTRGALVRRDWRRPFGSADVEPVRASSYTGRAASSRR